MTLFLSSSKTNKRKCTLNCKRNRCPSEKKIVILVSGKHSHNFLGTCSWPGTIKNFTRTIWILIRSRMGISSIFQIRTLKLVGARSFFQLRQVIGGLASLAIQVDMTKKSCSFFLQIISQAVDFGTLVLWNSKRYNV